jgi:hypothetical protein
MQNIQKTAPKLEYNAVSSSLKKANTALVVLTQRPSIDIMAAGLSLYLALKKQGKNTMIACATQPTVAYNRLFGVDKVTQEVGNKNLVISFPCAEDSLEKVSYNITSDKFNLVIEQKEGQPRVQTKDIVYNYAGMSADIVFAVGASKLEDLGSIYQADTSFFTKTQVVNISSHPAGTLFGQLNIFNAGASSVSELTASLIKTAQIGINADIATNLVAGIESATNNLAYKTTGDTFALLGWLVNAGGKRGHIQPVAPAAPRPASWPARTPSFGASMSQSVSQPYMGQSQSQPVNFNQPPVPFNAQPTSAQPVGTQPTSAQPVGTQPTSAQPKVKPVDTESGHKPVESMPTGTEPAKEADGAIPKPDWFKPKIYKGKTRV